MVDAYEIGLALAMPAGLSEGLAAVARAFSRLDVAAAAAEEGAGLGRGPVSRRAGAPGRARRRSEPRGEGGGSDAGADGMVVTPAAGDAAVEELANERANAVLVVRDGVAATAPGDVDAAGALARGVTGDLVAGAVEAGGERRPDERDGGRPLPVGSVAPAAVAAVDRRDGRRAHSSGRVRSGGPGFAGGPVASDGPRVGRGASAAAAGPGGAAPGRVMVARVAEVLGGDGEGGADWLEVGPDGWGSERGDGVAVLSEGPGEAGAGHGAWTDEAGVLRRSRAAGSVRGRGMAGAGAPAGDRPGGLQGRGEGGGAAGGESPGAGGLMGERAAAPLGADRGSGGGEMGPVMLDGRLVGHWLSERMARDASRPSAGPSFFDARQAPAWSPSGVA